MKPMYERLKIAHGILMTANSSPKCDYDLEPTCDLIKQAADHIQEMEEDAVTENAMKLVYIDANLKLVEEVKALKGDLSVLQLRFDAKRHT